MNRAVKMLLIAGAALTIIPFLVGVTITVISMTSAFRDLSQQGIADPHQLATHVGSSLTATVIELLFVPVGIGLLASAGIVHAITKPPRISH